MMERSGNQRKILFTILSVAILLFHIIPFYILVTTSLKTRGDFSSKWLLPDYLTFANFAQAIEKANLISALFNSLIITAGTALLLIVFGSMAAYPLARVPSKLNRAVFIFFISIMVIPPLTVLVPMYKSVVDLGLINTHAIAIIVNFAAYLPLTIFFYTGFIRSTVPKELEEAAGIDGTGTLSAFYKIVFPLLKPVTSTVAIISCVHVWNDFQFAIFFLQDKEVQTFTVAMSSFFGENQSHLNMVAAAALMSSLPMAVLFLFLQKYFIAGLTAGAVKS